MKWFKHNSDANKNDRISNMVYLYGIKGYGLYWYLVELINSGDIEVVNGNVSMSHAKLRIIAREVIIGMAEISDMITKFNDLELFIEETGYKSK